MKNFFHVFVVFLLLVASGSVQAQSAVTGKVIDGETKDPLPGVNIAIKGKAEGNFTSPDGKFSFNVSKFPITLVFSFIGFETQEVEVTGPQNLTIEMIPASMLIGEVVV